jgi:hypothetical protein
VPYGLILSNNYLTRYGHTGDWCAILGSIMTHSVHIVECVRVLAHRVLRLFIFYLCRLMFLWISAFSSNQTHYKEWFPIARLYKSIIHLQVTMHVLLISIFFLKNVGWKDCQVGYNNKLFLVNTKVWAYAPIILGPLFTLEPIISSWVLVCSLLETWTVACAEPTQIKP